MLAEVFLGRGLDVIYEEVVVMSSQSNLTKGHITVSLTVGDLDSHLIIGSWTHTSLLPPNDILVGSASFVQLTHVPNTDTQKMLHQGIHCNSPHLALQAELAASAKSWQHRLKAACVVSAHAPVVGLLTGG